MKRRHVGLLAVSGIVAMVVAACGGGEATATPRPPAPTAIVTTAATAVPRTPAPTAAAPTPPPTATAPAATPTPAQIPTLAPTSGPQPKTGGTLKVRLLRDYPVVDTYDSRGNFSTNYMMNVLSHIIVFDVSKPSVILPDLAERWEVSGDGLTTTFALRKDAKWHDGKAVTAGDVVWNLQRAMTSATATYNRVRFASVATASAPDDYTVKVAMKQPNASFLPNMASVFMLMYAPHGADPASQEFKSNAIGSGPFKLKEYVRDTRYDLVRNDAYFKKDEAGRPLPYLDGITLIALANPQAALAAFRAGQIDCGCLYDTEYMTPQYDILQKDIPGVKLQVAQAGVFAMYFNQRAPWTDVRVRKAIQAGIDRLTLKQLWRANLAFYPPTVFKSPDIGGGWGLPTDEMLKIPGWRVKDGKKDPADLDAMRQLFRDASLDPKSATALLSVPEFNADFGEAFQAVLSATGLNVTLKVEPTSERLNRLRRADFDISLFFAEASFDDPSDSVPNYVTSAGLNNFGKWQQPEVDALYADIEKQLDPSKRKAQVYDLQRKLLDGADFSPVIHFPGVQGTHSYVSGFVAGAFSTSSAMRLERVWINR